MDIQQVRQLLEGRCTQQSQWEFRNFILEAHGEHTPRAIQSVLARLRVIDDQLAQCLPSMQTLESELTAEKGQLIQWLAQWTPEEIEQQLNRLEEGEEAYWVERLAREAVIDMLTTGRVGRETMSRAILLSEENYRKFVETSGMIGNFVNTITQEVERSQGFQLPENLPR